MMNLGEVATEGTIMEKVMKAEKVQDQGKLRLKTNDAVDRSIEKHINSDLDRRQPVRTSQDLERVLKEEISAKSDDKEADE